MSDPLEIMTAPTALHECPELGQADGETTKGPRRVPNVNAITGDGAFLIDLSSDMTAVGRAVRDLLTRGMRADLFKLEDLQRVREWFQAERERLGIISGVSPDLLRWCVDMCSVQAHWSTEGLPFRPEHGLLPGYDWENAARDEWRRRNAELFDLMEPGVSFRKTTVKRPLELIHHSSNAAIIDPAQLREKYCAVTRLAEFCVPYVFNVAGTKPPRLVQSTVDLWGQSGRAVLALSSFLLFISDWDVSEASALISRLMVLPWTTGEVVASMVLINPFQDYPAWKVISSARSIAAKRQSDLPVALQILRTKGEMKAAYLSWLSSLPSQRAPRHN